MKEQKQKVCHLSSAHRWFDERIFQKQARSLARAGFDVVLIVPREQPETIDGVRIVPLGSHAGKITRLLCTDWRLLWLAFKEGASIYHFHDPELIPAGLVLKLLGKKVIYDVHEDYQETVLSAAWLPRGLRRLVSLVWGGFERAAAQAFDALVVVDSNIRRGFPSHKTEMITNVPPLSFSRSQPKPERSGPFRVVYTGAVAEARGVFKVVEALGHLRNPDVQFHVIGEVNDPEHRKILEGDPRIVCHGRLPWLQLRDALETADVGLMLFQPTPAHLSFTGEGNTKLFEFMGLGIPVLFADLPKLRRFMDTIGGGMAVDPTCPKKIAEAIDYLREHPEVCRTLGENGRRAVRERFHWEVEEKKLLEVYARVLARGRRAQRHDAGP